MSYIPSRILINKVENTNYKACGCCVTPTAADLIAAERRQALYLKEDDIEVAIVLGENNQKSRKPTKMTTKLPASYDLFLIVKNPDIEMQYFSNEKGMGCFERFPIDFRTDADIKTPHQHSSVSGPSNYKYTVVLPEMPPIEALGSRLEAITSVPVDSYFVKEEIAYDDYENKSGIASRTEPPTAREYYALLAKVHAKPFWNF